MAAQRDQAPSFGVAVAVNRMHHPVTALGPGVRAGIWFQGCSIRCRGCISLDTWEPAAHGSVPVDEIVAWIGSLDREQLDGITISGGEPFDQPDALLELLRRLGALRLRRRLDILCFSGRPLRVLRRRYGDIMTRLDAVVAEPYMANRPSDLIWRGSENQRLVPLSPLGRVRYAPYLEHRPERPPVQVAVNGGIWMIGVPRSGDLDRLEQRLQRAGVTPEGASWRA